MDLTTITGQKLQKMCMTFRVNLFFCRGFDTKLNPTESEFDKMSGQTCKKCRINTMMKTPGLSKPEKFCVCVCVCSDSPVL